MGARPKKLPNDYILYLQEKGLSLSKIKTKLYFEFGIEVSRSTLSRRLKELKQHEHQE